MLNRVVRAVLGCSLCAASAAWGQGYAGVYGDALGTMRSVMAPPYVPKTLYILAKPSGVSAGGITGAEFRIAIESPSGYFFSYTPSDSAQVLGNPLGAGANLAWPSCRAPDAAGTISLGTIQVVNLGTGGPTDIVVTHRQPPTNEQHTCPVFVLCDDPEYTTHCTVAPADSVFGLNK